MPRAFNGQVHVRVTPQIHKEVAEEAFSKGTSISGIFSQALTVRSVLRNINPWKAIDEVQLANRGVSEEEVSSVIAKAVNAIRKNKRA